MSDEETMTDTEKLIVGLVGAAAVVGTGYVLTHAVLAKAAGHAALHVAHHAAHHAAHNSTHMVKAYKTHAGGAHKAHHVAAHLAHNPGVTKATGAGWHRFRSGIERLIPK